MAYFGFFDSHDRFLGELKLTGSASLVEFRGRQLFAKALEIDAQAVLMVHNHPSGSARPSATDIRCTERLFQLGAALDIRMIDHLIVGGNNIFSFKQARFL